MTPDALSLQIARVAGWLLFVIGFDVAMTLILFEPQPARAARISLGLGVWTALVLLLWFLRLSARYVAQHRQARTAKPEPPPAPPAKRAAFLPMSDETKARVLARVRAQFDDDQIDLIEFDNSAHALYVASNPTTAAQMRRLGFRVVSSADMPLLSDYVAMKGRS
jgi:hypothetical protein